MQPQIIGGELGPPVPRVTGRLEPAQHLALTKLITQVALPIFKDVGIASYAGASVALVTDEHFRTMQIAQGLLWVAGHPAPDPLMISLNPILNLITKLPDIVTECRDYAARFSQGSITTKTVNLSKSLSFYARNICSAINLGGTLTENLAKAGVVASNALTGLQIVSHVGWGFSAIYNSIRGALSAYGLAKTGHYKSLLGRTTSLSDKLTVLHTLVHTSSKEIEAHLRKQKTGKVKFLTAYYEKKKEEGLLHAKKMMNLPEDADRYIQCMEEGLNAPELKIYFKEKLHLSDEWVDALTPQAFLGLIFLAKELALKKQEDFLSAVTDSKKEATDLKKMISMTLKVKGVAQNVLVKVQDSNDESTVLLFKTLDASMNRKQYAQGASCVIAALSIVGAIAAVLTPVIPFAGLISLVCLVIASALDYNLSLRAFTDSIKDNQGQLEAQSKDWSTWAKAMPWKLWVNMATNVVVIALTVALCCSPLGASLGVLALIGAAASVAVYTFYNIAIVNQSMRKKMVWWAETVDSLWQGLTRFMGSPIALTLQESQKLEETVKSLRQKHLMGQLRSLSFEKQHVVAIKLGFDPASITVTRHEKGRAVVRSANDYDLDAQAKLLEVIEHKIKDVEHYEEASRTYKEFTMRNLVIAS